MNTDERIVQYVWEKGRGMPDRAPDEWRQDECGAWLHRDQYNNPGSEYGWKLVNVLPDGADSPDNMRPFHIENSFDIPNGRPKCRVTADRTDLAPGQFVDQPRNTEL